MNEDRQAGIAKAILASEAPNRTEEIVAAFDKFAVVVMDAADKMAKSHREMTTAINKTYGPPPKKRRNDSYRIRVR